MNPSSGRVPLHKVTDLRERGLTTDSCQLT
jgi:hypothetical protein